MDRGNEIEVVEQKVAGRWTRVGDSGRPRRASDRPEREIDFIPMSRVLPAMEFGTIRAAFNGNPADATEPLNADSIAKLSYVMGRPYDRAETNFIRGLGLANVSSGASYSGFDMGSGESSVIVLLSRLQALAVGGLLVIEEVELGLHVEAQVRLMEVLLNYCNDHRAQIICTTHSEAVIDAVPRRARVLLRKSGQEHEALLNVSTRFAVHEMIGQAQPELVVYTEDKFASMVVEEGLTGPLRARIVVRDIGSNATLARQAIAHMRLDPGYPALSLFDGDCTIGEVENWLREERADRQFAPEWLILPSDGLAPEPWMLRELGAPAYRDALAAALNCSAGEADGHIRAMAVQPNHHDCGFALARRTGLSIDDARRRIVRAVARTHPGLQPMRDRISELLGENG